ncbi:MAG: hypothetical protein GY756_13100, partial [bacterium]|nr:hypothetical protein [bacterium]
DFTDDEITSNPVWSGNTSSFEIISPPTSGDGAIDAGAGNDTHVLRSTQSTGDAILTTPSTVSYGEWIFSIADGRDWSVSGTNDYKIILISNDNTVDNLTDGSHNFNGYFLQFDGGASDQFILYKQSGLTSTVIIDTNYPTSLDDDPPVGKTVSITRSHTGEWSIYIDDGFNVSPSTQRGSSVTDNSHTSSSYFGIATNIANPGTARVLYFDNLSITSSGNDATSTVSAGGGTEPTEISSLTNTQIEADTVLDVTFTDLSSGDTEPSIIDQIKFTQGANDNTGDWTNAIAGAELTGPDITGAMSGSITADGITFSGDDFISISDGGNETYVLRIWLNTDLSSISDNAIFDFKLAFSDITCDTSGSKFGSGEPESGSIITQITATDLNFSGVPTSVMTNYDFSLSVSAADANGNIDEDFTDQITLSKSTGTGNISSTTGLNQNAINGISSWNDLQHDAAGNFTISATSGSLNSATTSNILSENLIVYINEGFENGNLNYWLNTNDWVNSATDPVNGKRSLKHNLSVVAGESYINYPLGGIPVNSGTTTWRFNLKNGGWAPSSSNYFGVYLFADESNFSSDTIDGYIVGVDIEGSTELLSIWKVTNGVPSSILSSGFEWNSGNTIGIEVIRESNGNWTLKYDTDGDFDNLISVGTVSDNTFNEAEYFGQKFEYSSSRAGELWIDSIYISGPAEQISPKITEVIALSPTELRLTFTEPLDKTSAEIITNYTANNSLGNPLTSVLITESYNQITLTFSDAFSEGTYYNLSVGNINDLHSNVIVDTIVNFSYSSIVIERISASSPNTVDVYFSKDLNAPIGETESNYSVNKTIGNPITSLIDDSNSKLVHLTFTENLSLEEEYSISITNIEDIYNNTIQDTNVLFLYYEPNPFDIIVNEIMCDVSPFPEAVPPYKYIEIYNNSSYNLYLKDWTIQIGDNTAKLFPDSVINSGEYVILCEEEANIEMSDHGKIIPILNVSELTQTGKRIVLRDSTDEVIDDITYSDTWYDDSSKDDGGWSLERMDPTNFCSENDNWTATIDYTGGTPGRENSVFGTFTDIILLEITSIKYISSKQIDILFSEKVLTDSAETITNYMINGSVNPLTATQDTENSSIIHLQFTDNFNIGENSINILNIPDNCENMMSEFNGIYSYELIYPDLVEVMSENQLRITFSEKIDQTIAETLTNYTVNNSIGNPDIATISNTDNKVINLHFPVNFVHAEYYTINIENIEDINSNSMNSAGLDFSLYTPKEFDVILTEIMCDVSPMPEDLPGTEYLEIYNTSTYDINLNNWRLVLDNTSERILPNTVLEPGEYLVICHEDFASEFEVYSKTIGILGSSDLSTSGKNLKLYSANNDIIEDITYSKDWYNDEENDDGGKSIERSDLTNYCGNINNWAASVDIRGGTPGELNSVNASNPDNSSPEIDSVSVISSNSLKLNFTETISYETGNNPSNYNVDNSVGNPSIAIVDTLERNVVSLSFTNQFSKGETHTVLIDNISDNCSNILSSTGYEFVYNLIRPIEIWVYNETQLIIKFSETVDLTTGTLLTNYSADNNLGNPISVIRWQSDSSFVSVEFSAEFTNGLTVTLNLTGIEDVNGNRIDPIALEFTYYEPQQNDIIINEILFNPKTGGFDFVEIYNRSDYNIDLINFYVATRDENNEIKSKYPLSDANRYINPEEYYVFTEGRYEVLNDYMTDNPEKVLEIDNLPSFADDEGSVLILYKDLIIDEFSYTDDMHFELLNDDDGVSLERISFDNPTQDESNWHSASEYSGYATPAYENSQHNEDIELVEDEITIEPKQFSPDNDGIDDIANIYYNFEKEGYVANVQILNADGLTIKILANNKLLGIEGSITWDGIDNTNSRARSGIYLIYFEVFDAEGNVKNYKKTVVLAAKF